MSISFLRLPAVKKRTGLSRSTIYLKIKDGTFPAQVNLGPRAVAWTEESIDKWAENCVTEGQGPLN